MKCVLWTLEEDQFVRDNFPQQSDEWIGEKLNRTANSIKNHRSEVLNLARKSRRGKADKSKRIKLVAKVDLNRRKLFMAMMMRGKQLLGKNEPQINTESLISTFGMFENRMEMKYQ